MTQDLFSIKLLDGTSVHVDAQNRDHFFDGVKGASLAVGIHGHLGEPSGAPQPIMVFVRNVVLIKQYEPPRVMSSAMTQMAFSAPTCQ